MFAKCSVSVPNSFAAIRTSEMAASSSGLLLVVGEEEEDVETANDDDDVVAVVITTTGLDADADAAVVVVVIGAKASAAQARDTRKNEMVKSFMVVEVFCFVEMCVLFNFIPSVKDFEMLSVKDFEMLCVIVLLLCQPGRLFPRKRS